MEQVAVCRTAQAAIAHLDASVGQHVLKKTTATLFRTPLTDFALRGGRLRGLKSDVARCELEEVGMADGHAKEVRRKIAQGVRATAYGRRVHDPVFVPDMARRRGGRGQSLSGDRGTWHGRPRSVA